MQVETRVVDTALAALCKSLGKQPAAEDRAAVNAALVAATQAAEPGQHEAQYFCGSHDAEVIVQWDDEDGYDSVIVVPHPGSSFSIHDFSDAVQSRLRRVADGSL